MTISKEKLELLQKKYPPGTKVELVKMNDPHRHMPPGLRGEVVFIDSIGTILCIWNNGSNLGVVYGEDYVVRADDDFLVKP